MRRSSSSTTTAGTTPPPKLPRASAISLADIGNVIPFDGVRNPSGHSSTSHKVFLTYRTLANDWKPKVGIAESAAEAACGLEAVMSPNTWDVAFQPLTVQYRDEDGVDHRYTHDLLITLRDGHRRLVFVRNGRSLENPRTWRQIRAIIAATPKHVADDMIRQEHPWMRQYGLLTQIVALQLPLRSFGISSAIRPARVSQSRSRYPLR